VRKESFQGRLLEASKLLHLSSAFTEINHEWEFGKGEIRRGGAEKFPMKSSIILTGGGGQMLRCHRRREDGRNFLKKKVPGVKVT